MSWILKLTLQKIIANLDLRLIVVTTKENARLMFSGKYE